VRSHKGIHSTVAPFIFLLIPNTPSIISGTAATPIGIENIKIYLVIAVSARVNIVYK